MVKEIAGDVTTVVFRKDEKIMKRILITLTTMAIALLLLGTTSITAQAYDWQEHYEKMRARREQQEKEHMEKWLDELEADGNLTPEASEHATTFGDYIAYVLMILFYSSLLVRNIWITVEHICTLGSGCGLFYIPWIFKFRPVVGQYYWEVLLKGSNAYSIAKIVYSRYNTSLCAIRKQNYNHKAATPEKES